MSHRMKRRAVILSLIFALLVLSGCQQASQSLLVPGVQPGTQPATKTYQYKDKLITALKQEAPEITYTDAPSLDANAEAAYQYLKNASGDNANKMESLLAESFGGFAPCFPELKKQLTLDPNTNYSILHVLLTEDALAGKFDGIVSDLVSSEVSIFLPHPDWSADTKQVGAAAGTIEGKNYLFVILAS